jgi:hypothetical protein
LWLDKFQKNDIFMAIAEVGFAPADFELSFEEYEGDEFGPYDGSTIVSHKKSSASFAIGLPGVGYVPVNYQVADGPPRSHRIADWMPVFKEWLAALKRDLETSDLWATLEQQQAMLEPVEAAGENTPFTADELREIATQIGELKTYVKETYELSGDHMRALEGRLDYLQEAASRMGRVDWRNTVAGVLLSTLVNAVLPGDVARDALLMLFRSVGHMFGHPMPELPLGL